MRRWLSLLVLLSIFNYSGAQETTETDAQKKLQSLENILNKLEVFFGIRFSYESSLIKNSKVSIKIDRTSLKKNLTTIESQTKIRFYEMKLKQYVLKTKNTHFRDYICGYVLNAKTKTPIFNAKIRVTNKKETRLYTTDYNGYFEINNLNVDDQLKIQKTGNETKLIKASLFNNSLCTKISLNEEPIALNEVVISNYLSKGFSKKKDGSIVSKPNEIEVLPGLIEPDVLQSVQLIPGIQSPNETATGLNIRGSTPDQNLVIYDGIKIYNYNHFFGMLSTFNPYIIEQVRVGKGGSSLKYRSHLSGVFDVTSVTKIPKKIHGGVGANMIFSDAYLKVPISKKTALITSARTSFNSLLQTISYDAYSDFVFQNTKITDENNIFNQSISKVNSTYNFEDFTLKLISKIKSKSKLMFSSIYSKNRLNFVSQFKEISRLTKDKLLIENLGLNLNFSTNWSNKMQSSFSTSFSNYNFDYNGQEVLDAFFDYETIKSNRLKDINISLDIDYRFNNYHSLSCGYDLVKNEIDYTFSNISDVVFENDFTLTSQNNKNTSHELFTEYTYKKNNFFLKTGGRSTYFSSLKTIYFQGNLSASLKINKRISLSFSAEKKNQFVSQIIEFQTQNLGLENQVWVLANNEFPVLEKKQLGLSLMYNRNKFYVDFDAYINRNRGITSLMRGFNDQIEGLSSGKSKTEGMELLLKKEINNFYTTISYALTNNKFEFVTENNRLEFQGNFDIRHYLSVINSIKIKNIELSLGWRYKSPRPYTPANGLIGDNANNIKIDYGQINSERLSDYNRFDISSSYTFKPFSNKKIKGKLGLSVLNILNQENNISRSHRIVVDIENKGYKIREVNKFSIRRTPNFSFRLEF